MRPPPVKNALKSGCASVFTYYRCSRPYGHSGRCEHTKTCRAEGLGVRAWDLVPTSLRDPEGLRVALDKVIEQERRAHRRDPKQEVRVWLKKIAETDRARGRFQDMAAEGLITFDELRVKPDTLGETRQVARRELVALEERRARIL